MKQPEWHITGRHRVPPKTRRSPGLEGKTTLTGSPQEKTDADLVAETLNGRDDAFAEIVRRYEGAVAATVTGMLGKGDEAEEAGQETMIKLFRALDQFRGEAQLKTYITRIAINTSLDALRRRKRNLLRFVQPPAREDATPIMQMAPADNPPVNLETKQAVHQALSQLRPDFRAVVVLRLVQGYSTDEVADLLSIPRGTVVSRLSRAKTQLSSLLSGEKGHG